MDTFAEMVIRNLCLVALSLLPTLVGLKIIKSISRPVMSIYVFVFLVTLFGLPPIILIILSAALLILVICDVLFLLKFETYYFFGLAHRPEAIECMECNIEYEDKGSVNRDNGFVTFKNMSLRSLKKRARMLTKNISKTKFEETPVDKIASIIFSNVLFVVFLHRLIASLIS